MDLTLVLRWLASSTVTVIRQRHRIRMPGEQCRAQFTFRNSFALLAMP
jgi:hypothetical protein